MEVHHHPKVEKKNFKEYLFEGLMIFLAVTLGFFAENLRDNISNKEKENEYIQSLIVDLKADTTEMNNYFIRNMERISKYKLLLGYLENPIASDTGYLTKFYDAAHFTLNRDGVDFTDRVISQLKSSDNFRLINNAEVVSEIVGYSIGTASCKDQSAIVDHFTIDCSNYARQVINFKVYGPFSLGIQDNSTAVINLISTDHNTLLQYSNAIYMKAGAERNYSRLIAEQQKRAIELIALLENEYSLKN